MRNFLLFFCVVIATLVSSAMNPDELQYPVVNGRQYMISDPGHYLSEATTRNLESKLTELRKQYSAEVALVLPPDIGDMEPAQWCEQLFTRWQIGKKDKDNGLLIMISPGSRCAFIMPGYGMEGVFTDILCTSLVRDYVIPEMKKDNVDLACENVVSAISKVMADPTAAQEIASRQAERMEGDIQPIDAETFWTFVQYVISFIFFITLFLFLYYCLKVRRFKSHYEKAEFWRTRLRFMFVLGICSFGTGLVFFALAYMIYRFWRTTPLKCSTCGAKMKRLPEDKDNELLSDSQDFEENLKTVDYDVWECPDCGTIERFPFKSYQKKYTECPQCHTIAMSLESDSVVRPATTRSVGEGVKIYGCKYCHNHLRKPYVIPKKEDPSAAIAAAAVIGAASGRSRGGGGGFGGGGFGGFGGGATGGGGGGGRW